MHGISYIDDPGLWKGHGISGTIATIIALAIFITSIDTFRRYLFNFFIVWHWILFIPFAVVSVIHGAGALAICLIFSILDWFIRWYDNFYLKIQIKSLSILNANVIRLEFDKKDFMYDAGQYVFVCIPAISCMYPLHL